MKVQLTKYAVCGYILFNLLSDNGFLDSERSKESMRYENQQGNVMKTVVDVTETMNPCYNSSTWINPKVTREVLFDDGTETELSYRTHTWFQLRNRLYGEEFVPRIGEQYEVTSNNNLVRKLD